MVPAISHISAARFWLSCSQQSVPHHILDSSPNNKECPLSADCHRDTSTRRLDTADRRPLTADCLDTACTIFSIEQNEPLHFLVSGQGNRRVLEGAVSHSINGELPPRSILGYSAEAEIGIVSPEISFIQMSCLLSRIDAIRMDQHCAGASRRPRIPADFLHAIL